MSVFNNIYDITKDITQNQPLQALLVIGFYFIINYIIDLGFSYYSVFVIESKYGFNKMTKKTFFFDKIKSVILTIVFGGGAIFGIVQLYLSSGKLFFFIAWISAVLIMLFVNISYTKIFVPLFNKLRPLDDSPLKEKIYEFAEKVGYEISKISVIDASKRSTKLNAYFSGFGKVKRIVLYDTLIEKMSEEEIVAVLAHEIGHDIFHRNLASNGLKEFELFDMKNTTEYEANIFGSHLLIDNDEVLALARDGYDIVQISSMLNSHINLLLIKMQEMNKMGYDFNVPYRPEGDFLKKIKV